MPITTAALARRKSHLGSSDIAALMGLDPRRNRHDLWLDKTGKLDAEAESDNDPREAGKLLEPAVIAFAEKRLGKITRNQYRSAKDRGLPIGCNVDGILFDSGIPVEAKTSGLYGPTNDVWGDDGSDAVPDHILLQSFAHMIVTGKEICHVPVFIAFRGFAIFHVPYDPVIGDAICETAQDFWVKNVLADIPPDNILPHLDVVKRVRRIPESIVPLDGKLVDIWQVKREERLAIEKEEKLSLTAILTALGTAEAGECETGMFTYLKTNRKGYTVEPSTYRTPRFKPNKS